MTPKSNESIYRGRKPDFASGFTFVEILVVMVVLAVALVGVAWALSASVRASNVAARQRVAMMLAQTKIEEVLSLGDPSSSFDSGDFAPDWPDYSWQAEITGPDETGLYRVEISISWQDRGADRQETLVAYDPFPGYAAGANQESAGSEG